MTRLARAATATATAAAAATVNRVHAGIAPVDAKAVHAKFAATRAELDAAMIERTHEIDLSLTALVAGEHLLLVGPPGVGKSFLVDSITEWTHGKKFNFLLTQFTNPSEIVGPVSLTSLAKDHYRHVTTDRLPEADIAFLDETFNANSAILNTLLKILNEGKFVNDGQSIDIPLLMLFGASNHYPANEPGKNTSAFLDRFLFRTTVRPIATRDGLRRLMTAHDLRPALSTSVTRDEIMAARAAAAALAFGRKAEEVLFEIITNLTAAGINPSDRRKRKAATAARAFAWLNGHSEVTAEDLEVLGDVLWDDPAEQPAAARKIVSNAANPQGTVIAAYHEEVRQIVESTDPEELEQAAAAFKKIGNVIKKLEGNQHPKAVAVRDHANQAIQSLRAATFKNLTD